MRISIIGVTLTLAMSIRPPHIKQNVVTSSDGGRDGTVDSGVERYRMR